MTNLDKKERLKERQRIWSENRRKNFIKQGLTTRGEVRKYPKGTYYKSRKGKCESCHILLKSIFAGKGDGKLCGDCLKL